MNIKTQEALAVEGFKVKEPLSTIPSVAIRQAVQDAKECERHPDYVLSMCFWHEPGEDGKCEVCLAGAVIARRTASMPDVDLIPAYYEKSMKERLLAIDQFRIGNIGDALCSFGVPKKTAHQWSFRDHGMGEGRQSNERLFSHMLALADDLEAAGL